MAQQHISFEVSYGETKLISAIVKRAKKMHENLNSGHFDTMSAHMDLSACIAQGCPLKLQSLLDADDFNFAHDVFGIMRHMDRETGELTDCFVPRFARTGSAS